MTVRFEERAPHERGFAAVFAQRLAPELERLEARRRQLLHRGRVLFALATAFGAAAGLAFAQLAPDATVAAFMVGLPTVFGLGIGALLLVITGNGWSGALGDTVIPVVCDFIGDLRYDRAAEAGFPTERMRALGVIGGYDEIRLADRLDGHYRGTPFALVEAALLERYRDSDDKRRTRTVYRGLLLRIGVPARAPGRILIAADAGETVNRVLAGLGGDDGRGMPRVAIEDPRFEAAFEVHADAPDAARAFLTPGFREALLAIAETEGPRPGARGVSAGFDGHDFFLALHRRRPFLSVGSIRQPVAGVAEDLHGVFDDIATVHRIIDRLHGDRPDDDPAFGPAEKPAVRARRPRLPTLPHRP